MATAKNRSKKMTRSSQPATIRVQTTTRVTIIKIDPDFGAIGIVQDGTNSRVHVLPQHLPPRVRFGTSLEVPITRTSADRGSVIADKQLFRGYIYGVSNPDGQARRGSRYLVIKVSKETQKALGLPNDTLIAHENGNGLGISIGNALYADVSLLGAFVEFYLDEFQGKPTATDVELVFEPAIHAEVLRQVEEMALQYRLYANGSRRITGGTVVSYEWRPDGHHVIEKIELTIMANDTASTAFSRLVHEYNVATERYRTA